MTLWLRIMAERYFNPFQGIDVSVPDDFHESVSRYSQREERAAIDQRPFPRMVDMWFLSVCLAARNGLPPADVPRGKTTKIIEGSIFSSDPWRVHALMLIAIAHAGDVNIVAEPRKMMAIANGLAVAGLPSLIQMLTVGGGDPIWNLSDALDALLRPGSAMDDRESDRSQRTL